jgi:histone acetyltransferase (RNA polymerase elongator complex component)
MKNEAFKTNKIRITVYASIDTYNSKGSRIIRKGEDKQYSKEYRIDRCVDFNEWMKEKIIRIFRSGDDFQNVGNINKVDWDYI